jgi:hypothetical protein
MTCTEDPITEAQQRALSLLSEHHEPLSMSPGEVRQLLGRYRRGLSELTKAIGPPASSDHSISASDATSLWQLRVQWEDVYAISFRDGTWSASPFSRRTHLITADTAFGLREAMRADYAAALSARERCET